MEDVVERAAEAEALERASRADLGRRAAEERLVGRGGGRGADRREAVAVWTRAKRTTRRARGRRAEDRLAVRDEVEKSMAEACGRRRCARCAEGQASCAEESRAREGGSDGD